MKRQEHFHGIFAKILAVLSQSFSAGGQVFAVSIM
jgi:hypothetical protein